MEVGVIRVHGDELTEFETRARQVRREGVVAARRVPDVYPARAGVCRLPLAYPPGTSLPAGVILQHP